MWTYVKRLIGCGFSLNRAYSVCRDFTNNLPLIDLENFVQSMERKHVGRI